MNTTATKTCNACKQEKPRTDFYRCHIAPDGLCYECKSCTHERKRKSNKTEAGRTYYREYVRQHRQTPEGRLKGNARKAIWQKVRFGRMVPVKQLACVTCGNQAENYHHHLGYEREHWYDVIPLCRSCHQTADRKQRSEAS